MKNMVLDMQARMKIASEQMPTHLPAKAKATQEVVRFGLLGAIARVSYC